MTREAQNTPKPTRRLQSSRQRPQNLVRRRPSMPQDTFRSMASLSRRSALSGAGAAAAALGLGTVSRVAAQEATRETASHPMVGAWLVMNPGDPPTAGPVIFSADGT